MSHTQVSFHLDPYQRDTPIKARVGDYTNLPELRGRTDGYVTLRLPGRQEITIHCLDMDYARALAAAINGLDIEAQEAA